MKILVLAGGFDQIALIKELKQYGHQVLLADYNDAPPAKIYADKYFKVSTLDKDAILSLSKSEKIDLVTTVCTDQALLTAAYVSEKLELIPFYLSYKSALEVTNKVYMKRIMLENNIPTSNFTILSPTDAINFQALPFTFPIVVKPCDCNSSKGVIKVTNSESLLNAINNGLSLSRSKKVIVEEYREGRELSIDAWIEDNTVILLSISETKKLALPGHDFTICQSCYPTQLSAEANRNILESMEQIRKVFSLNNCPLLVQVIENNSKISVIEFSARMGGGTKYRLINHMTGIDIMKIYVDKLIEQNSVTIHPKPSADYFELDYIYTENGCFHSMVGFEDSKENDIIKEIYQYKPFGTPITSHQTSSDRVAGVLLQGHSPKELLQKRTTFLASAEVQNERGENIMLKNIYESR